MATEAEKEELVEILKFTPVTYRVELAGYGGEIVMGKVSREFYDYIKDNDITPNDYAWGSDKDYEDVPEGGFVAGEWHECDNIVHAWGAEVCDSSVLIVTDENGDEVVNCELTYDGLEEHNIETEFGPNDETHASEQEEGTCVFVNQSYEKGQFFAADINLRAPFNPAKLKVVFEDIDGWQLATSVTYDGEELDADGGDTNGKGSNTYIVCVGEDD